MSQLTDNFLGLYPLDFCDTFMRLFLKVTLPEKEINLISFVRT